MIIFVMLIFVVKEQSILIDSYQLVNLIIHVNI